MYAWSTEATLGHSSKPDMADPMPSSATPAGRPSSVNATCLPATCPCPGDAEVCHEIPWLLHYFTVLHFLSPFPLTVPVLVK